MKTMRKFYVVYLNEYIDYGDGRTEDHVLNRHKTYATTVKEAIRNLEYRLKINRFNCTTELPGDGIKKLYFTAVPVGKEKEKSMIEKFKNEIFIKCNHCGYNNEKERLKRFKACLNCHKPLYDENEFKKRLLKEIENEGNKND